MANKYFLAFRCLLLCSTICVDRNLLPKKTGDWEQFIYFGKKNRIISTFSHFLVCKRCSNHLDREIKEKIELELDKTAKRYKNYQKIKRKLKKFATSNPIPLMILKDISEYSFLAYPENFTPLKFDIDIIGNKKDLSLLEKFARKNNYIANIKPYFLEGKAVKYKFEPKDLFHTPIEFRSQSVLVPNTWKFLVKPSFFSSLTKILWQNAIFSKKDFVKLPPEYLLIYWCLLFYFEDSCKGLFNLYRIWLLADKNKHGLDWSFINRFGKRHGIENIIYFIVALGENIFLPKKTGKRYSFSINASLITVDLAYILRADKSKKGKDFFLWRDGFFHYSTRGFSADKSFVSKLFFFSNPKRIIFLFIIGIKSLLSKLKPQKQK